MGAQSLLEDDTGTGGEGHEGSVTDRHDSLLQDERPDSQARPVDKSECDTETALTVVELDPPRRMVWPHGSRAPHEAYPLDDYAINEAIADIQCSAGDWGLGPIEFDVRVREFLRPSYRDFVMRFLPKEHGGILLRYPEPLFRFAPRPPVVLGHYRIGRNDVGLRYEISINPLTFLSESDLNIAATLLHECLHLVEDLAGTTPESQLSSGYHSDWLRSTAAELGVPCSRYGRRAYGDGRPPIDPESPFGLWAQERGLIGLEASDPPTEEVGLPNESRGGTAASGPHRSGPKRTSWRCACPVRVMVARRVDFRAVCQWCHSPFQREGRSDT